MMCNTTAPKRLFYYFRLDDQVLSFSTPTLDIALIDRSSFNARLRSPTIVAGPHVLQTVAH